MLTRMRIRNFKRFSEVEIELGNPVVFVGPNDSGKTTALQALALWHVGLRRWVERRGGRAAPEKRPGVTINRRDLISVPVPDANLLWRDLHVRDVRKVEGKQRTQNVRVDITVEGVTSGRPWICGLEFDYANEESFYCRPLRSAEDGSERTAVPSEAAGEKVAFLPPMSGLAANETRLDPGAIQVRLGEGRTAEVLRNLCYQVGANQPEEWTRIKRRAEELFGVRLDDPRYLAERGEIVMSYRRLGAEARLDLASSGRGLQQTLLLLAHLAANPGCVLLLDEPDAHLEILRQRQVYQLTTVARQTGSQIIAASHSEIVLNEAADRDVVVAFVGPPHRIDDRGHQVLKSLKEIGFEQYYQAEQTGWVLYLEGSTDLAILQALSAVLDHPARAVLERPFVHYVQNQPNRARDHFRGLLDAKQDLVGFTLCDRLQGALQPTPELDEYMWRKREIENYLCQRQILEEWAARSAAEQAPPGERGPLFSEAWRGEMRSTIAELEQALVTLGKPDPWSPDVKATDDFLDPLFERFYRRLELPNLLRKTDYHVLASLMTPNDVDPEVSEILDRIVEVSRRARPVS